MLVAVLLALAAQASGRVPANVADPAQVKMVCKNFDEIGSRVRKRKVCRTRADWAVQNRVAREQGEQLRDLQGVNIPPR